MEIKKSPNADLENKKLFFVLIGLVFVLAIVFITLEWTKTEVVKYEETVDLSMAEQEELAPVTIQEQKVIPPPPPPEPVVNQVINIVENTAEETGSFQSSEAKQDEKIAPPPPPPPPRVDDDPDEHKFSKLWKNASFPGGDKEMMKYIAKTIKYPAVDQENGIQGRVIVSFVVNKDGTLWMQKL
jgi:protein TonB